jgi:hypothetical protein
MMMRTMIIKIMMMTLMKMKNMMMMTLTRMTKNENESNNVLESEKNHFGTFAKNIFNLNIKHKTTNNSRYEYSDHIFD